VARADGERSLSLRALCSPDARIDRGRKPGRRLQRKHLDTDLLDRVVCHRIEYASHTAHWKVTFLIKRGQTRGEGTLLTQPFQFILLVSSSTLPQAPIATIGFTSIVVEISATRRYDCNLSPCS
jgi:hypothetical protein